jgi:hypothetical protein
MALRPYAETDPTVIESSMSSALGSSGLKPTLTTSKGEVTIAPVIPPRLSLGLPVCYQARLTHLPAAECFHPDSFRVSGGEAVDGGVENDGDADEMGCVEKGDGVESVLEDEEVKGSCEVEAAEVSATILKSVSVFGFS